LNGIAIVNAYFHIFTGTRRAPSALLECRRAERITILVMVVLIIGGGIIPQPGVQSRYHAARALLEHRALTDEKPDESMAAVRQAVPDRATASTADVGFTAVSTIHASRISVRNQADVQPAPTATGYQDQ
jgi:hypothetical protein